MEKFTLDNENIDLYFSVHIPKTAGSFVGNLLESSKIGLLFYNYGEDSDSTYIVHHGHKKFPQSGQTYEELFFKLCTGFEGIAMMHGHFYVSRYKYLNDNAKFITWVRDPAQLLCSLFYYWKRWEPNHYNKLYNYFISKNFEFIDFATDSHFTNIQYRYLNGMDIRQFSFVGMVEKMSASLAQLSTLIPINLGENINKRINVNPYKKRKQYVIDDVDNSIRKANLLDYQIYDNAHLI